MNRRAGNRRCRRARRHANGSPRSGASPAHRCAHRPRALAAATASRVQRLRPAAHRARKRREWKPSGARRQSWKCRPSASLSPSGGHTRENLVARNAYNQMGICALPVNSARCATAMGKARLRHPSTLLFIAACSLLITGAMTPLQAATAPMAAQTRKDKKMVRVVEAFRRSALLAAAAMAVACGSAAAQTPVKFTLDWKFEGPAAPFLVAIDKGYLQGRRSRRHDRHRRAARSSRSTASPPAPTISASATSIR